MTLACCKEFLNQCHTQRGHRLQDDIEAVGCEAYRQPRNHCECTLMLRFYFYL
jgi:hypothetical protein